MLSRNGCYAKTPDVVIRPFEEWGRAYAFTPDNPEIYDLNSTAWLIVDLCDGRAFPQIEADYVEAVKDHVDMTTARTQFHDGFAMLLERNIISASTE
ncbi:MAG TPA: PqqD family protein [Hyphomicrobiaceae bacterium]|nr:PqqD family protein [Hyphomicrobiaceae bacterium]